MTGDNNHTHHSHEHSHSHSHAYANERKTRWVVYLTAVTMVLEIAFGYYTNSMALLADGFHMSTHTFALGLSWVAYVISRKYSNHGKFSFNSNKLLALSGYSSAVFLLAIAVYMAVESVSRLLNPLVIKFEEAIFVAFIGLAVNVISAFILSHDEHHSDHNIKAAYLHVIADALTSVTAIIALIGGMIWSIFSLDAISGILSAVVITKWSVDLIRNSGKDLIDFVKKD